MLKATLTKYFCAKFLIHLLSGGEKCYKPSCYDHDRFQVKLKCRALVSPKACEKNIPNLKNIFSCKETFLQHGCSESIQTRSQQVLGSRNNFHVFDIQRIPSYMIKILNSIIIYFIECPQVFCQLVASCRQGPHTAQRKKKKNHKS